MKRTMVTLLNIKLILIVLICCHLASSSSSLETSENSVELSGVIEVTTRTFDSQINDGSSWMIEFYAPWCIHCQRLEPTLEAAAKILHSSHTDASERKVKVGKIDGATERALASRFNIRGFPSIFLIDGWEVREYEGPRTVDNLVKFASKDYVKKDPIPFHSSPFGPVGQTKGLLMKVGMKMLHGHEKLTKYGLSPAFAGFLLVLTSIIGTLFLLIIVGLWFAPKEKED